MPDDKTLATILAICDLIKHNGSGVGKAVEAYERAMNDVIEYRRSKRLTEVGVCPALYNPDEIATLKARVDRH
jgi:predicted HTH transcriptional regulator